MWCSSNETAFIPVACMLYNKKRNYVKIDVKCFTNSLFIVQSDTAAEDEGEGLVPVKQV